jgi:hypothetical protein
MWSTRCSAAGGSPVRDAEGAWVTGQWTDRISRPSRGVKHQSRQRNPSGETDLSSGTRASTSGPVSFVVRSFSTNSRPACGRPPAAATLAPAATRRPPGTRPHPHAGHEPTPRRTEEVLLQPSEGQIPVLPGLVQGPIPAGLVLVIEIVLSSRATPSPKPRPHTPDPVQHGQPPLLTPPLSSLPDPTTRTAPKRDLQRDRRATSGPHSARASGTTPVTSGQPTPQLSSSLLSTSQVVRPPRVSLARRKSRVQIPPPLPHIEHDQRNAGHARLAIRLQLHAGPVSYSSTIQLEVRGAWPRAFQPN